jgi:hypothetical protein
MNCQNFESIAGDLAREQLMDAAQRESALAHTASCASCAARLADERSLTGGFRFVAKDANQEAPPRVEVELLAVFRQRQAMLPVTLQARSAKRRRVYVAAAAAAILVIVALLALVSSRTQMPQQPAEQKAEAGPGSPERISPAPQPESPERTATTVRAQQRHRSADRLRNASRAADHLNEPAAAAEIATEFIPLMNRETLAEMDGGQVMRVELPRSALVSFGLPMDMERATERIKADVLVGNDGMARAIRFVR